jgi:hypothetical protein
MSVRGPYKGVTDPVQAVWAEASVKVRGVGGGLYGVLGASVRAMYGTEKSKKVNSISRVRMYGRYVRNEGGAWWLLVLHV